jgi:Tfp pilus assembly major pilin PilA
MHRFVRLRFIAALTAAVFLAGCHKDESSSVTASSTAKVDAVLANQHVAAPAWLAERLPDDAIAYLRIPSPWGLVAAPDGRALDPLLASAAHVKAIDAIKTAFANDPTIARTGWQPLVRFFLDDLASPLEVAALGMNKVASPATNALITFKVRYTNVDELNKAVTALATIPSVQLQATFDANGDAQLNVGGKPAFAHFDAADQRVMVLAGMSANATELADQIKKLTPHAHAMRASESRIDQSGQGFFLWLSIESLRPMASMALSAPDKKFANDIVTQTRSVALGWGTVNGKGRVSLLLDAPGAKLLRYLPRSAKQTTVASSGEPHWVVALSLPTAEEFAQIQQAVGDDFGAQAAQSMTDALDKIKDYLGFDAKDLLAALGPELATVGDDAGTYTAVRLRDAVKFNALIDQLVAKFRLPYQTRDVAGIKIHYLTVPSFGASSPNDQNTFLNLFLRLNRHYYWIESDGNLLFADIPQTLIDYHTAKSHQPVGAWLTQRQGLDDKQSLLSLSTRTQNTQRALYSVYLQGLQALADISGAQIDLFAMPTPDQIALPRDGALGMQVHASNDDAGIDFVFEQSPFEVLTSSNGSMASVAVIAIVAAVALPAYQDYTVRAQVSEGLVLSDAVKVAVAEYYASNGKLPRDLAAAGLPASINGKYTQSVRLDNGAIVITFGGAANAGIVGKTLRLVPYVDANAALRWQCGLAQPPAAARALVSPSSGNTGGDVPAKYLPILCRATEIAH